MKEKAVIRYIGVFVLGYLAYSLFLAPSGRGGTLDFGPVHSDGPKAELRHAAPDFSLMDLSGNSVRLSALRGQTVVVTLWAPWCPSCLKELPQLERLAGKLPEGVRILAIATDYSSPEEIRRIAREKGVRKLPILLDSTDDVGLAYDMRVFPSTYIIDGAGVVRYALRGVRNWESASALEDIRAVADFTNTSSAPPSP